MNKFFEPQKKITIKEIISISGAIADSNNTTKFTDVATLKSATSTDISFFNNKSYSHLLEKTNAGACFINEKYAKQLPVGTVALISEDPYSAFAKVSQFLYPTPEFKADISKYSVVDSSAKIGKNVYIGNFSTIGKNVVIGNNVYVANNVTIYDDVIIGDNSYIFSNVSLKYAHVGNNCIIHDGVRIGQDGFGFAPSIEGPIKIPQIGGVIIADNVEIGANTCIDRGALENTSIGSFTKIDNLVQIAHNVTIGSYCFVASGVGIAGSAEIEDMVMIGGHASIAPHVKIVSYTQVAPMSGVAHSIEIADTVIGIPAMNFTKFWRLQVLLKKMLDAKKVK